MLGNRSIFLSASLMKSSTDMWPLIIPCACRLGRATVGSRTYASDDTGEATGAPEHTSEASQPCGGAEVAVSAS